MTVQPACSALLAKLRLTAGLVAKKASLTWAKSKLSTSRTLSFLPANIMLLPADSMLASRCRVPTGKASSSRICTRVSPTLPVAPTTAISRGVVMLGILLLKRRGRHFTWIVGFCLCWPLRG